MEQDVVVRNQVRVCWFCLGFLRPVVMAVMVMAVMVMVMVMVEVEVVVVLVVWVVSRRGLFCFSTERGGV